MAERGWGASFDLGIHRTGSDWSPAGLGDFNSRQQYRRPLARPPAGTHVEAWLLSNI
jgi:hypothetical protein